MPNLEDFIGKNFERVLRWVYPGALFMVLLGMSNPQAFRGLYCSNLGIGLWGLVVGGLVAGFVVYLLQGYVVSYFITLFFILIKWDVRQGLQVQAPPVTKKPMCFPKCIVHLLNRKANNKHIYRLKLIVHYFNRMIEVDPICCPRCIVRLFDRMAKATRDRWSGSSAKDLQDYLNYAWGTYHAVLMTGWLTTAFYYLVAKPNSVLLDAGALKAVTPAWLLLLGGLFTYALLTRIRIEDP